MRVQQSINMKTDHRRFDNSWYNPGRSFPVRVLWYATNVLFFINPMLPVSSFKVLLLRLFGAKIGRKVVLKPGVSIKYPWRLQIGDYSWVGENVWIDNLDRVTIGSHVCVSQGAYLLTGNHNYKSVAFDLQIGAITLEDGVWIGAKAIVCPGVQAQSHAVLTAGSVAVSALEPYSIYQGNPAVKIRDRVFNPET